MISSSTALFASNRSDHRPDPSGAPPQASAMMRASLWPSSRGARDGSSCFFREIAPENPRWENLCRMLKTVWGEQFAAVAISSSGRFGPLTSANRRTCIRRNSRTGAFPPRKAPVSFLHCIIVSFTSYFFLRLRPITDTPESQTSATGPECLRANGLRTQHIASPQKVQDLLSYSSVTED